MKKSVLFFLLLACLIGSASRAWAQPELLDNFSLEIIHENLNKPVGISFDELGRMYFWEKGGKVYFIEDGNPVLLLDISEEVAEIGDNGLTGFALHPDFYQNGHFYVYYAVDRHYLDYFGTSVYDPAKSTLFKATIGRLTRYSADPATGFRTTLAGSRKIILGEGIGTGLPILDIAHGTGDIKFGTDGTLLVANGDGSAWRKAYAGGGPPYHQSFEAEGVSGGFYPAEHDLGSYRAQLIESPNGKILRIDPETGLGVPSNPFYDENQPDANASRVWALGLRMPFRMTIRPGTGQSDPRAARPGIVYAGDVSGGFWEELNIINVPGSNHGWPLRDAFDQYWNFFVLPRGNPYAANPLYGQAGCEDEFINFFDLLRDEKEQGTTFPNPCDNTQMLPDDVPQYVHKAPSAAWIHTYRDGGVTTPTITVPDFDENGDQYGLIVDKNQDKVEGKGFWGQAVVGTAFYTAESYPDSFKNSLFVSDFEGWIKNFEFDLNDSLVAVRPFFKDTMRIVDMVLNPEDGCLFFIRYPKQIAKICYGGNVPPVAILKSDKTFGPGPLTVQFQGEESYDPQQQSISFHWDFGDGSSSTEMNPSHNFTAPSSDPTPYTVTLTVTDSLGKTGTASVIISLNNTPPLVSISSFNDGDLYPLGGTTWLPLEAEINDAEHSREELTYVWETYLHHNTHFHLELVDTMETSHTFITSEGCGDEPYWYRVSLTVTDPAGLQTRVEGELFPDCIDPFVEIEWVSLLKKGKGVDMTWRIMNPQDVWKYVVQRSPDGVRYESIGDVNHQNTLSEYTYPDGSPRNGANFYRIMAVDANGNAFYSEELYAVVLENGGRVFPNPTSGLLILEMVEANGEVVVEMFNQLGQKVLVKTFQAIGSVYEKINVNSLEEGIYYYRIRSPQSELQGKILKIRP